MSAYGYDGAGRLTSILHEDSSTTLASYSYTLDAAGNRTAVKTLDGTESYTYDALNRITSATYPNSDVVAYTYDAAGNRLSQSLNSVTTASYSYDDAGQMTSDGTTSYSYDDAGNLTDAGSNSFEWDWLGRMTSATVGSTTEDYTYDGTDLRVSQTVDSTTTDSLWDRLNSVPLLVDDGTYSYLHTDGLLARVDSSDAADYYLTDALGSVRGLTDDAGDVTGAMSYDVFGAVRSQTGVSDVFGFAGEQTEDLTGFTYLRARYLDPALGRFVSADSVIPNAKGTQGYGLYAYVANRPCMLRDPSGHCPHDLNAAIWIALGLAINAILLATLTFKISLPIAGWLLSFAGYYIAAAFMMIAWCLTIDAYNGNLKRPGLTGAKSHSDRSPTTHAGLKNAPAGYP